MPLKLVISKKVLSDFWHGENIHWDRKIPLPTLKLRQFYNCNISKNRHMKKYYKL